MKLIRLLILPLTLLLLTSCNLPFQKLDPDTLIGNPDTFSHIRMLDGKTGEMVVFAPGEDTQAVLNFIESLNGTYDPEFGASAGYLYWLAGYRDGKEVFRLTFGSSIVRVDGKRYKLNRGISSELDQIYEMAPYGTLLTKAMNDLADQLEVQVNEIKPISVDAHTFPDASLGVPEDGKSYAQVKTQGYIFTLSYDGVLAIYHATNDRIVQVPN